MLTTLPKMASRRATSSGITDIQFETIPLGINASESTICQRTWRAWSPNQEWEIKWPVIADRDHYFVRDAAAAGAFTLRRTFLLDLLLEAYPKLASLFGDKYPIKLERASDPDMADRSYLLVTIMTSLPVSEALTRMDRFTDEWWLDHIAEAGRYLVFVVDFI